MKTNHNTELGVLCGAPQSAGENRNKILSLIIGWVGKFPVRQICFNCNLD